MERSCISFPLAYYPIHASLWPMEEQDSGLDGSSDPDACSCVLKQLQMDAEPPNSKVLCLASSFTLVFVC